MLDPRHRSFGHEPELVQAFDAWLADSSAPPTLWEYLAQSGKGAIPGVSYLGPGDRWKFEVFFDNGRMYRLVDRATGQRELLSTKALYSAHTNGMAEIETGNQAFGTGVGIWVCSSEGAFYTAAHEISVFHHSSFTAGRPVLGAGEWVISNGELLLVTNKTGHYKASPAHLAMCLSRLRQKINLDSTVAFVQDFSSGRPVEAFIMAGDLIRTGGIPSSYMPRAMGGFAQSRIEPILSAILRTHRDVPWASPLSIGGGAAMAWAPSSQPALVVARAPSTP
jgi:hypothetical protein